VKDWIARWATYTPHRPAVKDHARQLVLSYADLNRLANRLAHHLTRDLGLKAGDRIGMIADNCVEYVILFGALQKTGIILAPYNYRLSSGELDYLLQDSQPKLLITEETYLPVMQAAPTFAHIPHHYRLGQLRALLSPETLSMDDAHFPAKADIRGDDAIFILYTSGTTGFPKGACYTHDMLLWNSLNTELRLHITGDDCTLNVMPPFHTGGWNVLLTPFLHHGAYTILLKKFEAAEVLQLLDAEPCTIFMGVPTMLKMMADSPAFAGASLEKIRYFIVGGEAMPVPLIDIWAKKGIPVRQGYGMTEVGPNLFSLHQDDALRKKGSIGQPNFYVETRIVDEKGRDMADDEAGELLLRGPMVTPGYWQHPEATAAAFLDGWFRTGDRVRRDPEGYYYVVDRIKNMFISGGENVYPAEIERVLRQHPAVREACVVAMPHPKWGEVGKAFLSLQAGHALTEADILAFCQDKLARFKIPKAVVFLDELPKNATGKIDRKVLQG